MKRFKVVVSSMTATYTGYRYGECVNEVIEQLREEYRRNKDNRAGWNIRAREVSEEDDE